MVLGVAGEQVVMSRGVTAGAGAAILNVPGTFGKPASEEGKGQAHELTPGIVVDGGDSSGQGGDAAWRTSHARQPTTDDVSRRRPALVWTPSPFDGNDAGLPVSPLSEKRAKDHTGHRSSASPFGLRLDVDKFE